MNIENDDQDKEKSQVSRGGARDGAGRPKGKRGGGYGGVKRIYVPIPLADAIEKIIFEYKQAIKKKD